MQIVIDIDEEIYNFIQNTSFVEDENTLFKQTSDERQKTLYLFDILDAIRNGTPLPEHHGRIADLSAVYEDICNDINAMTRIGVVVDGDWLWAKLNDAIDNAPTIIEGSDSE